MQARTGDRLIIKGHRVGEPDRDAEILEVRGPDGGPPYVVRWEPSPRSVDPEVPSNAAQPAEPTEGVPPVVALVCSTGGLDALQRVLRPLPPSFPGALIVLLNQSPDQVSHLPEILARNCGFPVRAARHGDTLTAGTVYVVPPGYHAALTTANSIALIAADPAPPSGPSADLLLTSLALTAADRSVAVVLSGLGHDGATGATALHDFGGVVVASNRDSGTPVDMPEAAIQRDAAVDFVLPVDEIPALLVRLADA